jgi:hypothetical protein
MQAMITKALPPSLTRSTLVEVGMFSGLWLLYFLVGGFIHATLILTATLTDSDTSTTQLTFLNLIFLVTQTLALAAGLLLIGRKMGIRWALILAAVLEVVWVLALGWFWFSG